MWEWQVCDAACPLSALKGRKAGCSPTMPHTQEAWAADCSIPPVQTPGDSSDASETGDLPPTWGHLD